jgi:hypothetical protein
METLSKIYLKQKKKAGSMAQVIEFLPSKNEVLNSNPSTTRRKKGMKELVW